MNGSKKIREGKMENQKKDGIEIQHSEQQCGKFNIRSPCVQSESQPESKQKKPYFIIMEKGKKGRK